MNHTLLQEKLSAFVDGELNKLDEAEIKSHISNCPECRRAAEEYRLLRASIRAAAAQNLAASFASDVTRAARLLVDPQVMWGGVEIFARRLVIALMLVVFLVVSVDSLNSSEQQMTIEPGFSGVSVDSTVQQTLLRGEVSKEDMILAMMER
ncbi:MAG: zf-HC2 domain-containing protein [Ignavibacteriae bacterium]|nr:zf-HC2 domain-containing protein [Ignavibacteriota bacterium]